MRFSAHGSRHRSRIHGRALAADEAEAEMTRFMESESKAARHAAR